ncbi:MAG: hypothetical protein M1823_005847 [Watsoniomyces obsoletus]|nr:MAG: hypothetical protein M1823_005847 [Watsoniomyces obsoletus]
MPFSHHSHSGQFCLHAKGTLEEMVQAAIAQGFQTFALTEHMPRDQPEDLYPEEIEASLTPEQLFTTFKDFYHEALRLREQYSSKIHLLIGFESEWIRPSTETLIKNLLQTYEFDLFVGSLHHVGTIPIDFDRPTYERARAAAGGTEEDIFKEYFDTQYRMLSELQPPVVGHFDLIRLYADEPDGDFQRFPEVWTRIERNLEWIAHCGGLLEVNSSALRKGLKEPYPGRHIIQAFQKFDGRLTLSDDSHAVEQVGLNYQRTLEYLDELGVTTLYYLERSTLPMDRDKDRIRTPNVRSVALKDAMGAFAGRSGAKLGIIKADHS